MEHRIRRHGCVLIAAAAVVVGTHAPSAAPPRFYPDDPLAREPETQDASMAASWDIDLAADLLTNSFAEPGESRKGVRAENVNTADEVPDSSWFTNRIYVRPLTPAEIARGPNTIDGPAPGPLTVTRAKSEGSAPGFTVRDTAGIIWFLTFDAASRPHAATGAIAVATRLFWALGYNVPENYLTTIDPARFELSPAATIAEPHLGRRPMQRRDVDRVLERSAREPGGGYRTLASRAIPGKPIGGFYYFGTRPDDPNDIVPHEHRRELRALKVFGAWTNLVDLKAGNTLDTLVEQDGRHIIRHYLQDVGSTFGTGALGPREWDEGHEHLLDGSPLWKRLVTMGLYIRPWQTVHYEDLPEIGRFEGDAFDPDQWRSRVPAAAPEIAREDDTFWAALRVGAFTDELIRAAVAAGEYSDPHSAVHLASVLARRRDTILRAYLPRVNPVVDAKLDASGKLTFDNAAVRAGVAPEPAGGYRVEWHRFDNTTGAVTPIDAATLAASDAQYVRVAISAPGAAQRSWAQPVHAYFRRGSAWSLVGFERMPEARR